MNKLFQLKSMMFLMLIGASNVITAQVISGKVSDDSGALPGVSVIVKGTAKGTTTDFDGMYSLSASNGDTLVFSYVGVH